MRSFSLFPCHSIVDGACTCGRRDCRSPGKHPLTQRGFLDATRDPHTHCQWLNRWPFANFALPTGSVNGVLVLDVDAKSGGLETFAAIEDALPPTWTVATGGGGLHKYFALRSGDMFSSRVGWKHGIDVRGEGGYVIAPGSVHASGRVYRWVEGMGPDDLSIAPIPAWVVDSIGVSAAVVRASGIAPTPLPPPNPRYMGLRLRMPC